MKTQMNAHTGKLHDLGQRIWLDNITREMLNNGTLARYIAELSVTGLTSNPTIFEHAIGSGDLYDEAIHTLAAQGLPCEDIFFELALQDMTQAADLFRPIFDASSGADGWVSLEVSPLLANDTTGTIQAAARLHARAARPNLFIRIPGTPEGIPAIEQLIFDGVPVRPQRLLWASTGTKDPAAPDMFYVEALAAAETIDTIPGKTLLALADHGKLGAILPADGGDAEGVFDEFKREGVDDEALAARLQREGVQAFAKSWSGLMARIPELQDAGIDPDVWTVEGLDLHADGERIVQIARRAGREQVGCTVLGRGADEARVRSWLTIAAGVPGFIGFAVGRTSFWDAVSGYRAQTLTRAEAATQIAGRLREWVDIFEGGRQVRVA